MSYDARVGTNARRAPQGYALQAAAQRIDLGAKLALRRQQMGGPSEPWQLEARGFFYANPEAGSAVLYTGNQMSKVRLYPGARPPDDPDGNVVPADDEEANLPEPLVVEAQKQLARLKSELGGQGELLRILTMNLETVAEGYLVGVMERPATPEAVALAMTKGAPTPPSEPERWEVVSKEEVSIKGGKTTVSMGTDKPVVLDPEVDWIIRIWQRDPFYVRKAHCAMRHCLPALRLLHSLTSQVTASTNSQMHSGILFLPNSMTFGGSPVVPDANQEHKQTPFEEALDDSFATPIEDPENLLTVRPMVVFGERDDIAAAQHMVLSRPTEEAIDARVNQWSERLALGLNLPIEVIKGHMNTTYANAGQIDQDTFDDYVEPRARLVADAITIGFLRPQLLALGYEPKDVNRVVCWYDPTALIGEPDSAGAADFGLEHGAITPEAWRRVKGFSEADAPDAEVDEPDDAEPIPPVPVEEEEPAAVAAAGGRRRMPLGARLAALDVQLQDRLSVAFSLATERALERATARLRTRASAVPGPHRDLLANASNRDLPRVLGPGLVNTLLADGSDDELFEGAWVGLAPLYRSQVKNTQTQARRSTSARLAIPDVEARQAEDLEASWGWAEEELNRNAKRALFEDVAAAVAGEADPSLRTPAGLVRQAMARAGGERGIDTRGADEGYLTFLAGTDQAAGGVATGTTLMDAITETGATIDGYTWVYGDAPNPFEPHRDLDGHPFAAFEDLTNDLDFPPFPFFFPGDHIGCTCLAEPTILGPDGEPL